jgi:hypothetical protein
VLCPGHPELGNEEPLDVLREAVLLPVRAVWHIAGLGRIRVIQVPLVDGFQFDPRARAEKILDEFVHQHRGL